ncbi:MAG: TnpV protein [Clostridia bacterium]|nr:TnpV protein [Clostridia bacterium]
MKSIFEEKGGTYTEINGVMIPNLVLDPQPEGDIGIWGWRRKRYLKEHRKGTYNRMLMEGTITQHLININEEAMDMRDRLVEQFQEAESVSEELKRRDQMAWVGAMNSIYNRVDEIILHDLIYT